MTKPEIIGPARSTFDIHVGGAPGRSFSKRPHMHFTIANLRERPEFFNTVADRVWNFAWKSEGFPLQHVSAGLGEIVADESFPFAIVAHDGHKYLGSALGIASDLQERPQYTPWIAAVWVEPQYRGQSIGRSLALCAARACFKQGFQKIYLCARAARHDFYVRQGWVEIEKDIGPKRLMVFVKEQGRSSST